MVIELKNGIQIKLDWNFLVMEYLEEYEGGLKQLKADIDRKVNQMKLMNQFLYAIVCANYDEVLTRRQAVSLVKMNDLDKIRVFIENNLKKEDEFKKKEINQKYGQVQKNNYKRH